MAKAMIFGGRNRANAFAVSTPATAWAHTHKREFESARLPWTLQRQDFTAQLNASRGDEARDLHQQARQEAKLLVENLP